jgi:hypothetical protein
VTDTSAVLLLYLVVALLYGTARVQGRARLPLLQQPWRRWFARVTGVGAAYLSMRFWTQGESGVIAALLVLTSLMSFGSVVALLGPVAPRLIWALALAAAVAFSLLLVRSTTS